MLQGSALQDLHHPQPPLHKKGLQTTLQTSRQSLARGLIDSGQRPPSVKVLVWLSSLCPFGVRHDYIYFRKHSSQAKRQADYRTVRKFPHFIRKHSARGGIHRMYYYRNLLRFLYRVARQANRHEMLFERSEFLDKPSGKAERIE